MVDRIKYLMKKLFQRRTTITLVARNPRVEEAKKLEDGGRNSYHIAIFFMVSILAGVALLVGRVQHSDRYVAYYHKGSVDENV